MPAMTTAERLAVYGLREPPNGTLKTLRVARGQRVLLDHRRPPSSASVARVQPQSLEELKRMIGVPDRAMPKPRRPTLLNLPTVTKATVRRVTPAQRLAFRRAVHNFVYKHSATVTDLDRRAMDSWLEALGFIIVLPVFQFADVVVGAGSSLSVDDGAILFAHNITVEAGGVIHAGMYSTVDCNSFTGL